MPSMAHPGGFGSPSPPIHGRPLVSAADADRASAKRAQSPFGGCIAYSCGGVAPSSQRTK